jgi:protein TonB
MGYQALLFCPDEKTARTVTQVLSELEFAVEACSEPFAAVKKLMAEHFDALVVDCDNEQNAALLFKSARNSTSNQASLAVAVVEGQAGVAKAFRIGANLVLTKPINVEQAKGTLRVARGLLRKGEPGKPAAPATPTVTKTTPAITSAAPAASPSAAAARPTAAKASPVAPRPAAPAPVAKPATPASWPGQAAHAAVASSSPAAHDRDDDVIEITEEKPVPPRSAPAPVISKSPAPPAAQSNTPKSAPIAAPASFAGAASAPAAAREAVSHVAEAAPAGLPAISEKPADQFVEAGMASSGPAPSFTFGGANTPEQSSGGSKKILLGIAAAVILGAALYIGWTQLHGKIGQPSSGPSETASSVPSVTPAATSPAKPAHATSAPTTPVTSAQSAPVNSQPDITIGNEATPDAEEPPSASTKGNSAAATKSAKTSAATVHTATKSAPVEKPEAEPIMVKNGVEPKVAKKSNAPDAAAPSMAGLTPATSGAPLANLVSAPVNAPKPVLEALTISQGVSQGLLIKKVQPSYPPNALRMRIEGSVLLLATISKSGNISAVKIVSGDSMLTHPAADAVKQWKYKPYLLNGEPVEIQTQITVNFKLPR